MHYEIPGYEKKLYIADTLAKNLERVKISVLSKGWDYVGLVCGLPGVGKSTFAQAIAKFFDRNFEVSQICFTAREFIDKIKQGKKGQAFILDESFADLNTSLSRDPEFIATINTLQLIRQNNLFLILVLPDFFSLSAGIAITRASHLFIPYSVDYERGDVAVFDRGAKNELYNRGKRFRNYQAWDPNFRCDFNMSWFCDKNEYDRRKREHLMEQSRVKEKLSAHTIQRDILAAWIHISYGVPAKEMADRLNVSERNAYAMVAAGKERLNLQTALTNNYSNMVVGKEKYKDNVVGKNDDTIIKEEQQEGNI